MVIDLTSAHYKMKNNTPWADTKQQDVTTPRFVNRETLKKPTTHWPF